MWQRSNTHLAKGKTLLRVRISLKNIEEEGQETPGLAQDASGLRSLVKRELSTRQICSGRRDSWKRLLKAAVGGRRAASASEVEEQSNRVVTPFALRAAAFSKNRCCTFT